MFCIKCGMAVQPGDKCCSKCGNPITENPVRRFCMACGCELREGQLFCTNCGTVFDEKVIQKNSARAPEQDSGSSKSAVIKSYSNQRYTIGKISLTNSRQGTIIMREDRIDIIKNGMAGYLIGGIIGGSIAGAVKGSAAAAGNSNKPATVTIPYQSIKKFEKGRFGRNKTIIITMDNDAIYTLAVGNNQDEIYGIISQKQEKGY